MCNRYLCDVLREMRTCYKTRNFSYLPGLIEEAQHLGNKMESALEDQKDIRYFSEERSKLKKEVKELKEEKIKLRKDLGKTHEPFNNI